MSWSGIVIASWNPGYEPLSLSVPNTPEKIITPDNKSLSFIRSIDILELISPEGDTYGFSRSKDFWIATGFDKSRADKWFMATNGGPQDSAFFCRYRYLWVLCFAGVAGEMKYQLYDNSLLLDDVLISDDGHLQSKRPCIEALSLPEVLSPQLALKLQFDDSGEPVMESSVDEFSMMLISSLVGVDLLAADDDLLPAMGAYSPVYTSFLKRLFRIW